VAGDTLLAVSTADSLTVVDRRPSMNPDGAALMPGALPQADEERAALRARQIARRDSILAANRARRDSMAAAERSSRAMER
jgi:hypothetical protein